MALQGETNIGTQTFTAVDGIHPTDIQSKILGPQSATAVWELRGLPLAYDAANDYWMPWTVDGADELGTIRGFLWDLKVSVDDTNSVPVDVVMAGTLPYASILLPAGELQADLDAALIAGQVADSVGAGDPAADLPSPRELGLVITGLPGVK